MIRRFVARPIAVAVSSCFAVSSVFANPTGPQIVSGTVSMQRPDARTLNVTNSPGAIINWQGFSIGQGEVTRFIQQSSSSAVLNRVVGADISQIHGQLLSNGRVFLINPAGIVIGGGATIDTGGFVASTLNMLNADFIAGKLKFQGDGASGSVVNHGLIRTSFGGNVILVAPQIENSGLIQTPGGELILAAGQKLTIGSLDHEGVRFELQAPTDSVLNVGKLLADGGAVGVFAGTLKHTGDIRANALVRDDAGRVVLKAQSDVTVAGNSTISTTGKTGGNVHVLGDRVRLEESSRIDVSGETRGGTMLIGGDYQGSNTAISNASTTYVGADALLRADATASGDGGRIIVWADRNTRFDGALSARGAGSSGKGGFAEVSGKTHLLFTGKADLGAANGRLGDLLLDPLDTFVTNAGGLLAQIADSESDFANAAVTVSPATLAAVNGNVSLYAGRYMRIIDPITLTTAGQSFAAQVGTHTPGDPAGTFVNQLDIAASITTNNGAVSLTAPRIEAPAASTIATSGGAITLSSTGSTIAAANLALDAGTGAVNVTSASSIRLGAITGGSITAAAPGSVAAATGVITGALTATGPVDLRSSAGRINTGGIATGGGSVTVVAQNLVDITGGVTTAGGAAAITSNTSTVRTRGISTGNANVAITATDLSTNGNAIDTTGNVTLTAAAGNIAAVVDNAASLTATATRSNNSDVSVNISSNTALNAADVSASHTVCCRTATTTLTATGNVNVGNVRATSLPAGANLPSEFVSITSNGGSILPTSGASQVDATNVTLRTGLGTGGGIGSAAAPLNVNVSRNFTFAPNGAFNTVLNGNAPNQLQLEVGVAPAGQNYTGTLVHSGGGLNMTVAATDTTVTLDPFAPTIIDQRVGSDTGTNDPFLIFRVPNGNLVASSITVPQGDTNPSVPLGRTTAGLPVTVRASGDLTVNAYTRQSTAASLPKQTTFQSDSGNVTLGTIAASKDAVTVRAFQGDVSISASTLTTAGNVNVIADAGNIRVGQIDTTSGTGSVSLTANNGTVGALESPANDTVALEVLSGSTVSVSARQIGTTGFANPLDLAGTAITLTAQQDGSTIGSAAGPVIANTQNLTINAANNPGLFGTPTGGQFNVSTGPTALTNLFVRANPAGVGPGGLARVRTEAGQPGDRTYDFVSDGANFTLPGGTVPASQFNNGTFSFTSNSGNIVLQNFNLGPTGSLIVNAQNGSITGGAMLDGAAIALNAGTGIGGGAVAISVGDIGTSVRPAEFTATAGNRSGFTNRVGTIDTGNINAETVALTSHNGGIRIGATGTGTIGSAAMPAGTVTLAAQENSAGNASGTIAAGNIFGASLSAESHDNTITIGTIDVTGDASLRSNVSVATGTIDAAGIVIRNDSAPTSTNPTIQAGAIGGSRGPSNVDIQGSTVTINGPVAGDPAAPDTFNISARSGLLAIAGAITGGDGSTITLESNAATPFEFTRIDAGATGTVTLVSPNGISQTADGGSNGLTAAQVTLRATTGSILNPADPAAGRVDLFNTSALTVDTGGTAAFDAHLFPLQALTLTKRTSVAANPFELVNLAAGQTVSVTAAGNDMLLAVTSPTPLHTTVDYVPGGITLAGGGILTSGGNVTLTAQGGGFDGSAGITTGGADGGGAVTLSAAGVLTTGPINTAPTGTGTGGAINAGTDCANCGIVVNGDLNTGPDGDSITLNVAGSGSITRIGTATITSPSANSVTLFTRDGNIGTAGAPMLLNTPTANLTARFGTAGNGFVFADLTGTNTLTLSGENGFNVRSLDTPFTTLSVATRGTGTGTGATLDLSAPGQSYSFARPTADVFANAITDTFQVIDGGGTTAPPATTTFNAIDGDLLVAPGATLGSPQVTLLTTLGDIKLQGAAGNALTLNIATQNVQSGRDLIITGDVNLASPVQTLTAAQDLLVTGNVNISSTGTQTLRATRDMTVLAQGGVVNISAPDQNISTTNGTMTFTGGNNADETVMITATTLQRIGTPTNTGGNAVFRGGAGDRSNVTVEFTGPNVANSIDEDEQRIQVRGTIQVLGGGGLNSDATITTATADQLLRASGGIMVTGGGGIGSDARVTNTGTGTQHVGESRRNPCCQGFPNLPYQTGNIIIQGGSADNALGEVTATGPQRIYSQSGSISVLGGTNPGASARIESTSATEQHIGLPDHVIGNRMAGGVIVSGGAGAGATGSIVTPAFQFVTGNGAASVGSAAMNASALLQGVGQDIRLGSLALRGGAAANAFARVTSSVDQVVRFGSLALTGGSADGASARMDATGIQTFTRSGGSGNISLTAGGDGITTTFAGANALIEGQSQTFCSAGTNCGAVTLTGGAGTADATSSDALMRNLGGAQQLFASSLSLTSGNRFSTTGLLNQGTGAQTITTTGGISLQTDTANPAQTNTAVRIDNTPATNQTINARFVDVFTRPGSSATATARILSGGNQWIHTSNGGIQVAALGAGSARIQSGATQLLEVDYPVIMTAGGVTGLFDLGQMSQRLGTYGLGGPGPIAAAGTSRVDAVNQTMFAGGITIQGPSTANQITKLAATTTQTLSVVVSGLRVLGGSGDNTQSFIDPTDQTIVVTGPFQVIGGSGMNATAGIFSQGTQQLVSSTQPIEVTGGTGPGASASIVSVGPSTVTSTGPTIITSNPTGGSASVSSGALPSSSPSGAESVASSLQTNTLLTEETYQSETMSETGDEVDNSVLDPRRRPTQTEVQLCS